MDKLDLPLRDLVTMMELQIQGMAHFQQTQTDVRDALKARDWLALEKGLRSLDFQAEGLRCLEERRDSLWHQIQQRVLGRKGRFYETVPLLPEAYRDVVSRLHRSLKVQVTGLKGVTEGLASYIQTAGSLIQAVIHEIQPALKGRLYSRSGYLKGGDAQHLVLNTQF
jgi:hypothetical protein